MPRIRTIKPEFWSSPSMEGLSPWVRLLFIAMWNWADDYGRGSANPKELAGFAFPHDDHITAAELPCMLTEVAGRFGVCFYRVAERRFYAIPTWDEHQRNERRSNPKHPPPDEGEPYDPQADALQRHGEHTQEHGSSDTSHGTTARTDGSFPLGNRNRGNRNRGTGPPKPPAAAPVRSHKRTPRSHTSKRSADPVPHPDAFDRFWSHYPRKQAKQRARAAWARAVDRADPATIVAGAERQAAEAARATDQRFTPLPSTWLREDRWDDTPLPPPIATTDLRIAQAQALKTDDAAPAGAELNGRQDP